MKNKVLISIDENLHKKAKMRLLNISQFCENKLRDKVGVDINQSEDNRTCFFCNFISGAQLIWLCPDEKWICDNCLSEKVREVKMGLIARR